MRKISPSLILFIVSSFILAGRSASAQILLKPRGQEAVQLRIRSLAADVRIERQFATTHLTLTFQNETGALIEADFFYTLPPDTTATHFAYWYGDERVVARIVEKERAAAIYQHITSQQRDPALVEMIGKNRFRARIFPIMPNADLRVEMTLVQVLPSTEQGPVYELPLRMEKGQALEAIDVDVHVRPDPAIRQVENNFGLPVEESSEGYQLTLSGINYRPQKDLRVLLARPTQPLHAVLYAARSGGRDGFFALALTPDRRLSRPRIRIEGIRTYHLVPTRLPAVQGHQTLTLFGRYRGSGKATVRLEERSDAAPGEGGRFAAAQPVRFGAERVPNNLAIKLWGAHWLEHLGASPANRAAVIDWSQRVGLPSRFTSWLAIPREEKERYLQEKLRVDIGVAARRLAREIAAGRDRSGPARQSRAELQSLCRRAGWNAKEMLGYEISDLMDDAAHALVAEKHRASPDRARIAFLRRQLDRLARAGGASAREYLDRAEQPYVESELARVRELLLAEHRKDHPDPEAVRRLEARFTALNIRYISTGYPQYDWPPGQQPPGASRQSFPEGYARARTARLAARTEREKLDRLLASMPEDTGSTERAALEGRRQELVQREDELRARMGDPLIRIEAPADAVQVVALLPGGEVKRLAFDPHSRRWEARFDIPTYAAEGEYVITVIVVLKDGTRKLLTMRYHVDVTPPKGAGQARVVTASEPTLRLELVADTDTARVAALLPWDQRLELQPSAQPHRFFALVPVPKAYRGQPLAVTFVLTDRAHNRTSVLVDVSAD